MSLRYAAVDDDRRLSSLRLDSDRLVVMVDVVNERTPL